MKDKILHILKESTDYVSGEKISNLLNVSRTAIWKNINSLKEEGYKIDSVSRKGYKLINGSLTV
jgi:BirA family biotin operon repressor/biotin-[acetyl-CoA-carboxylase] ligase